MKKKIQIERHSKVLVTIFYMYVSNFASLYYSFDYKLNFFYFTCFFTFSLLIHLKDIYFVVLKLFVSLLYWVILNERKFVSFAHTKMLTNILFLCWLFNGYFLLQYTNNVLNNNIIIKQHKPTNWSIKIMSIQIIFVL